MPKDIIFSIDNSSVELAQADGAFINDEMRYTDIEDATEVSTRAFNKMTTSIPTPFARLYLYEGSFKTLIDKELKDEDGINPYRGKAFKGSTINHYVVADALDMLEFLFEYGNSPSLKVDKWTIDDLQLLHSLNIPSNQLEVTIEEKHNLLYESIKSNTTDGNLGDTFYIFKWINELNGNKFERVIGGTSPLTLAYSAPNWRTNKPKHFFGGNGNELFISDLSTNIPPRSLIERSRKFREYIYALYENYASGNHSPFFEYIRLTRTNYELDPILRDENINETFNYFDINPAYTNILDTDGNILKVKAGGQEIPLKGHATTLDEDCEFVIEPTVDNILDEYDADGTPVNISDRLPLLLSVKGIEGREKPHYWNETGYEKNNSKLIVPSLEPFYDRTLPGVPGDAKYPNLRAEDFFEDKIVKVSYYLDRSHFITGAAGNSQYLLPIKPLYFKFFKPEDLANHLRLETQVDGTVRATLSLPVRGRKLSEDKYSMATVKFERVYTNNKQANIVQIETIEKFNLAIFPFYSLNGADSQYNCYEVMLGHDGNTELKFYNDDVNDLSENERVAHGRSAVKVASVDNRTIDSNPSFGITTTYYRLGNSSGENNSVDGSFQFIQVEFGNGTTGLIVPKWYEGKTKLSNNDYVVSVDFGTTNTHISYAQIIEKSGTKVVDPTSISDMEYECGSQVVTLSEPGSYGAFSQFETYMQREFVPQEIIKNGDVKFPIRTSIYEKSDLRAPRTLFGEMNIAFALNEDTSEGLGYGKLQSNIKWGNDPNSKNRVRAFFTETMWIIKNKIVELGGNMDFKLIFTFPQSMSDQKQSDFIKEWRNVRSNVRAGNPDDNNWSKGIRTRSNKSLIPYEGTAPWYRSQSDLSTITKFLNVDIGGGTFDVIAVQPTSSQIFPGISFSAQFAASDLWGDGQQKTAISKNGFYEYYKSTEYCQIFMDRDPGFRNYYNPSLSDIEKNKINVPPPSDIIPYLFKHDENESEFSTAIKENDKLRSLVVLHFGAIIYYVGRVLLLGEIKCPSHLQFTGMGSLYINLITDNSDILTRLVRAIIHHAVNGSVEIPVDFRVEFDHSKHHPKKITAEGALMMWNTTLPGSTTPIVDSSEVTIYGFEGDEDEIVSLNEDQVGGRKDAVMERMKHFLEIFENGEIISILAQLGIVDVSHLKYANINRVLENSFDLMHQQYSATSHSNVKSKEAVFFWPLKEGIHKLALDYAK